ncbi:MAG: AAA family ATPase, partial [FCB group bacterium]|nr:AAA family ATPase [FCB group bacterium]
ESVVDRIFITGVMPILLDSLTSGFNIGANLSIDARFNEMFGFTEEEIAPILDSLGGGVNREIVRTYYDGYRFSPRAADTVYNSAMILYYGLRYDPKDGYIDSMLDTNVVSDYRKIRAILSIGDPALEEQILRRIVEENAVSVNRITELFALTRETEFLFDAKSLVSLLFYMGYLTISTATRASITLAMPNLVLKSLYLDYMKYQLMKRARVTIDGLKQDEMPRDLLDGRIDLLIELTEKLLKGLSNRDYQVFDEKYIKVVMLSLLSDVNVYIPHSEYEVNADGHVDLYLQAALDPDRSADYFIELKYAKAKTTNKILDKKEHEAKAAMRKYLDTDAARAIRNLHAYTIVFRKDACVRRARMQ